MNLRDYLKDFIERDHVSELLIVSASPFLSMYLVGCGFCKSDGKRFEHESGRVVWITKNIEQYAAHFVGRDLAQIIICIDQFQHLSGNDLLWLRSRVRYVELDKQKIRLLRNPWDGSIQETHKGDFEVVSI